MSKIKVFATKAFPSSADPTDRYEILGPDDLAKSDQLEGVRGIIAAGHMPIGPQLFARLPDLEIVARFGVGYDTVDMEAARAADIVVTNTPDVLTDEVADLALGLLIATVRRIPQAERYLRAGRWPFGGFPLSPSLRGRKVGIFGLGRIGGAIAHRVSAMGLEVAYCNRSEKPDAPYAYYPDALSLAQACDIMIVVVPGGAEVDGIVNAEVIRALGPTGVLINVARGSVVDEPALIDALSSGSLGAAGLDVFANEPHVPDALIQMANVVLLPHIGSAATTTREAMGDRALANLDSWFAGTGPLNPVT